MKYYLRFGSAIKGPFQLTQIEKFREAGKLVPGVEISLDQVTWQPAIPFLDNMPDRDDFLDSLPTPPPPSPLDKIGVEAGKHVKAAGRDAWMAFLIFATNPVGGLPAAFNALGPTRALSAGIAFGVAFAACVAAASSLGILRAYFRVASLDGSLLAIFKAFTTGLIPFFGLVAGHVCIRKIFRVPGTLGHDSFVSGAALLPLGAALVLFCVLGVGNIELIVLVSLFVAIISTLMLYVGMTQICGTSEYVASFAVPSLLVLGGYLGKVILMMFFSPH